MAHINDGVWQMTRGHRYSIDIDLLGTDRSRIYPGSNILFRYRLSTFVTFVRNLSCIVFQCVSLWTYRHFSR
jgi:hypothetical protein